MFGEILGDIVGLPFRVANIPMSVAAELAARIDPDDDAAIKSLAEEMAKPLNTTAEVVEAGIRKAIDGN